MESIQPRGIHPLIAGAAVSVMLVSLLGTAAITGILPNSQGSNASVTNAVSPATLPVDSRVAIANAPIQNQALPKKVVHHEQRRVQPVVYAQAEPARSYSPPTVYQQPAPVAQNSPLGIGVGAIVGGVLGNQVGHGRGKALATLAGAIGGGYIGNEVAIKNR